MIKKELLNEICRIVVADGGFRMAWAGLVDSEKQIIVPTATSGHIDSYLDTITISTENIPGGKGPTGTAFRRKIFNVCNDIENAPKMASWRKGALERGYHSLAAFPFAVDTRNAGVITYFASEKGFFTEQIIRLLEEQAGDISFALDNLDHEERRITAETELRKSEHKYRRLFETAQDAILILDGDSGEIIDANKFILDMLGYPLSYFVGKHLWELGFIKDKSLAKNAFSELKTEDYIQYENIPLETKDGKSINFEFISNVYRVDDKRIIQCNIRDITERKRAEEERSRLASIVEYSDDAIIGKSLDGLITRWNAGAERIYGYSADEMIGRSIAVLVPPDLTDDTSVIIERIQHGEPVIRYDTVRRKKDGGLIHVSLTASQVRDARNQLIGVYIVAHDITLRKQVEGAMHVSEARYRRLFETAQDAILILDGDTGEIIDANKFILDMLGYPLGDFVGKHLWELGFLKDKTFAQTAFEELQTDGYIRYENLPLETKQGDAINVEFISNVYQVGDKKIIQCNIRDITERKVAHDIVQVSETRYRRLFETAQDAILILDGDTGEIIDANKFILDMLGYPLEDFVGRHLWELGFLKDKAFAKTAFEKLQTDGYIRYEDLPLETKRGNVKNVEFISNVYLVGDKKIIQCNIRDITERKRAEEALTLASRKLNLLSGITRHDIMNQLTVLSGSLELSLGTIRDAEGIAHINRAQKAAKTIQHQISFTKEYEELGVRAPAWLRPSAVARAAAMQLALKTIAIEVSDEQLEIYADPLLVKVFYNLFDNARQYGGAVTKINISNRPAGTGLILSVEDNGGGLTAEDKKHLFERGFGKHTGLGLFLSREILSITGITIRETGEPGRGARFEITVPEGSFRFSPGTSAS
jgi:PAS domain S-box-containing protein